MAIHRLLKIKDHDAKALKVIRESSKGVVDSDYIYIFVRLRYILCVVVVISYFVVEIRFKSRRLPDHFGYETTTRLHLLP